MAPFAFYPPGAMEPLENAKLELVTDGQGQYLRASVLNGVESQATVRVSFGELSPGTYEITFQVKNLDRQTWRMGREKRTDWADGNATYASWRDGQHDIEKEAT